MTASDDERCPAHPLLGEWRIVETDRWDKAHLEMVGPAFVRFDGAGAEMQFGCLEATLDCAWSRTDVDFTFDGSDEGTEVSGDGWAEMDGPDAIAGEISFRHGDRAVFKARRSGPESSRRSSSPGR